MSSNTQSIFNNPSEAECEAELMDSLLASPTISYPWNPEDAATADYYAESDSHFCLDDWSESELTQRSQSFFTQLQQVWVDAPTSIDETISASTLTAKFGTRVPQQWLEQIAAKVTSLAASNLEPVDRLVQSVSDLLSTWANEDLLVMARPYAYAMRCNPGVDEPDNIVRPLDWQELSEVERAKLTIAIAQYAIENIEA
jgi:hypothetical protein